MEQNIIKNAYALASKFNGTCLSQKSDCSKQLKFKCQQGHVFVKSVGESLTDWCPKCVVFYRTCLSTAKQHGFDLEGNQFQDLAFKCKLNHLTKISYSRRLTNYQPLHCMQCLKMSRDKAKQQIKDEEQLKSSYFAKLQEEAFDRARAAMQEELKNQEEPVKDCVKEEQSVNAKAAQHAATFMKENIDFENLSLEQAYLVYKFVFISEELMVKGLMGKCPGSLQSWFRATAKLLHPDKNCHPQAKEAF